MGGDLNDRKEETAKEEEGRSQERRRMVNFRIMKLSPPPFYNTGSPNQSAKTQKE